MIQEVIVVEGKKDIAAIRRAVDAECLATGGFSLSSHSMKEIEVAYQRNGIIILTDPDSAGERIRKILGAKFPLAKHAFITKAEATKANDIGVERASGEVIRSALSKARCQERLARNEFISQDLQAAGLSGRPDAAKRRAVMGDRLGIGYANSKTLLRRLNHYGVTREEFAAVIAALED